MMVRQLLGCKFYPYASPEVINIFFCFCFFLEPKSASDDTKPACPDRLYVMERYVNHKFIPGSAVQVDATTLKECQEM